MKVKLMGIVLVGLCGGCETLSTALTGASAAPEATAANVAPDCSHEGRKAYEFKDFADGHHYLFKCDYETYKGKSKTLAASVNVKDGFLVGDFEIYYDTGVFKYKGFMDCAAGI